MSANKVSDALGNYWKNPKRIVATALAVILFGGGGWYWYTQNKSTYVPAQFFEARNRAGEISSRIVNLTDASVDNLSVISAEDRGGNYSRGLELVLEEVNRNTEIRNEAVKLSEELKIMAISLGQVKPEEAVKIGLRAITNSIELVQRLVNYNNYTYELLNVLQTRLQNNGSPETRQRIEQLILKMNEEAEAVNELNRRYQDQMKEFDRLTK